MQRIVVTGGAGFIGSALVKALEALGKDVVVADKVLLPGSEGSVVDLVIPGAFDRFLGGLPQQDCVIHLAGPVVDQVRKQPGRAAELQLEGTINVLEGCRMRNVPKIVLASSFYVYCGMLAEHVVNEATPLDLNVMDLFGASKWMSERLLRGYAQSYGLKWVIHRFGSVYGYSAYATGTNVIRTFLEMGFRRQPIVVWGPGKRRNQYTLLNDVVAGVIASLDVDNELFNLVSPYETTTGELAEHLKSEYGFEIVFDADKPEGASMAFMVSAKAVRELEWLPTPMDKGIAETVEAMRRDGAIDGGERG